MIRMIFVVLLIAILKTPGAAGQDDLERGGTLPLRLRAGGTLPLKLGGEATSNANSRIATQITITQATAESLSGSAGAALNCQTDNADVSKHAARGTVLVGLVQFAIKGICFNHVTQQMEVVAERGAGTGIERSFLAGSLTAPEPRAFAGSLVVTGATPPAGSYSFSTRAIDEIIQDPRQ